MARKKSQDKNALKVDTKEEKKDQDAAPPAKKLKLELAAYSDEEVAATWFDPEVGLFQLAFDFQIQLVLIIYRYCNVFSLHRSFRLMIMLPK